MEMTWDVYFLLLLSLAAGYAMGLGSRFIVRAALKDYIEDKMSNLHTVTTSYTQKVQIQCDGMIEQANKEALKIYKEALSKSQPVVTFHAEETDLN